MKRYHNKVTLSLQIVFAVICLVPIAFLLWGLVSYGLDGSGWAEIGLFLLWIVIAVAAAILLVPFILLMIFCKKPWIALPAYLVIFALVVITILVMYLPSGAAIA